MCEYALINLNMIEYAGYLKKQSAEYARILNVSDAGFVELGHFDKHFVKNTKKEATFWRFFRETFWRFFS